MFFPFPSANIPPLNEERKPLAPGALHVTVKREPFGTTFEILLDNGHSEELECGDETREWFKIRGANMDAVERALDYCMNFYYVELFINNPKDPLIKNPKVKPRV